MNILEKINNQIKKAKSVVILSHVSPDGDTLGSMLALYIGLQQLSNIEKIDAIKIGKTPDIFKFLPEIQKTKAVGDETLYQNYDLAISVDCGALDRLTEAEVLFRMAKNTINIDHHISNPRFGDLNWIDEHASSTGIQIFKLLDFMGLNKTKDIAICLYTSIMTDTGGFRFDNTNSEAFNIASSLLEQGVEPNKIYKLCYESKPLAMIKLKAKAINEAIISQDGKIAYSLISRNMLEDLGASDDHVEGISEELRQINSVKIAMVFKETPKGYTKVSFRSNGPDVCEIAKFFGGGGHKMAAGCTIQKKPEDAANELLPIVKKQLKK